MPLATSSQSNPQRTQRGLEVMPEFKPFEHELILFSPSSPSFIVFCGLKSMNDKHKSLDYNKSLFSMAKMYFFILRHRSRMPTLTFPLLITCTDKGS